MHIILQKNMNALDQDISKAIMERNHAYINNNVPRFLQKAQEVKDLIKRREEAGGESNKYQWAF
jgi:hypothetical protein